jgi:hypothetical protein
VHIQAGSSSRSCLAATRSFDGTTPECLQCEVVNCVRCVDDVDTCGVCEFGHGVSVDKKQCLELETSVLVMGKGHYDREVEVLKPNAQAYSRPVPLFPHPHTPTQGAGALIHGVIYAVTQRRGTECFKLANADTQWAACAKPPWAPDHKAVSPFFATLNGVGKDEDGFYIFSTVGSAVYKPADDKWTTLPLLTVVRKEGGTATVGSKIFVLGGRVAGVPSALAHTFDAATGKWAALAPMKTARLGLAGASYHGKVYAFGGNADGNVATAAAEVFDPASNKWAAIAPMPDRWAEIGNGQ